MYIMDLTWVLSFRLAKKCYPLGLMFGLLSSNLRITPGWCLHYSPGALPKTVASEVDLTEKITLLLKMLYSLYNCFDTFLCLNLCFYFWFSLLKHH